MRDNPQNMDTVFRDRARRQPEHPAVIGPGRDTAPTTYGRLDALIDQTARALSDLGVECGDSVGLHSPSGLDYIVHTYAAWRLGATVVPIPVELVDDEKREILRGIRIDALVSPRAGGGFAAPFQRGEVATLPVAELTLAPLTPLREHPEGFHAVNAAFIRFTSGTTGRSKGVVLSHETIDERIRAANEVLQISPKDRVLWLLSMSYHFTVSIVAYLSAGATILLPRNHLAQEVLATADRHGATFIYGSPIHYDWMADAVTDLGLRRVRLAISTTAPLDQRTASKFHERFGLPVTQALGIIEVGLPFINVDFAATHPEALGRPLPSYRTQLIDLGLGARRGKILVQGPGFLDAYYEPWRPRSAIMKDGWFDTGDIGEIDDEGCLFLRGRAKDVINVLGMKFFPQEVETVLVSHPAVAEACVLVEPSARLGEAPYARIVLKERADGRPSTSDLLDFCRTRMASYKVPTRIEIVPSLAKTASGKILHRAREPGRWADHGSPPP